MTLAELYKNPIHCLAFGFGSGLAPKAPGTAGTLLAVPLFLLLCRLPALYYSLVLFAAITAGIWLCDKTARDLRVHDHPGIVWDEFVGYWITMAFMPVTIINIVAGFVLFRLFDIWKPFPIRWLDRRIKGGIGIMADDIAAGVLAWLCLYGLHYSGVFV